MEKYKVTERTKKKKKNSKLHAYSKIAESSSEHCLSRLYELESN